MHFLVVWFVVTVAGNRLVSAYVSIYCKYDREVQ